MAKTTPIPLKTWQRWAAYRYILGDTELEKIYKVGLRTIQRYSADPDTAESSERNPDDRHRAVLKRLCEQARIDLARQVVADDAFLVRCELRCLDEVIPDQADMKDEILDDHPAILGFHEAIRKGEDPVAVHERYQQAMKELQETYALYCKTKQAEL